MKSSKSFGLLLLSFSIIAFIAVSPLTPVTQATSSNFPVYVSAIVQTSYNGSYLLVSAVTTLNWSSSSMTTPAYSESVFPQYGYLSNDTWGYLGYYEGTFAAVSGRLQDVSVTVSVTYNGTSETGSIVSPVAGQEYIIPLTIIVRHGVEATPPPDLSLSDGASVCPSIGGYWNGNTCAVGTYFSGSLTVESGVTLNMYGEFVINGQLTNYGTIGVNNNDYINNGVTYNYGSINVLGVYENFGQFYGNPVTVTSYSSCPPGSGLC